MTFAQLFEEEWWAKMVMAEREAVVTAMLEQRDGVYGVVVRSWVEEDGNGYRWVVEATPDPELPPFTIVYDPRGKP